jgi:hypothetical protein
MRSVCNVCVCVCVNTIRFKTGQSPAIQHPAPVRPCIYLGCTAVSSTCIVECMQGRPHVTFWLLVVCVCVRVVCVGQVG